MKKRVWIMLLIALTLSLVFSLAACDLLGLGGNNGGQAPTFKSVTISNTAQSGADTFVYAETYDSVYVTITLDNPDNLAITSVKINDKTYEATSFESGSTRKQIVVRVNVGNNTGIVPFTVEAIQYVDSKVLKDVALTGSTTVYVGVSVENQVSALVTEEVGFTEITLNVTVMDDDGLIAFSNGNVQLELYCEGKIVEGRGLTVGNNTVTFDNLDMGQWYLYNIVGSYDNLQDGKRDYTLHSNTLRTKKVVEFGTVNVSYDSATFSFNWHEDAADNSIKQLKLIDGTNEIELSATATKVDGLYSNRDYAIVAYFEHGGQSYQIRYDFHTLTKHEPDFYCSNLWVAEDEIRFDVMIYDPDSAGTLVTTLNGQQVTPTFIKNVYGRDQIAFANLTYGQTYAIEISYDYDLNDGEGVHPYGRASHVVTVDSPTIHQTSCKLEYRTVDHDTCIVYKNAKCTHQVLAIPSTIDGYTVVQVDRFSSNYLTTLILPDTVTKFATSAFANCKNLTSVTLPQNLSVLGEKMFSGCEALSNVTIPAAVTEIPTEAFYGCEALTSITIPANVQTIGNKAFRGSGLQTLTFAQGSKLTTIGTEAFYELSNISELTLPSGLVNVGNSAFYGLNKLTTLTIPSSVETISASAFSSCRALQSLSFEADSELRVIGNSAFNACERVTELLLPSSLTSIGDSAFVGIGVGSLTIPKSVVTIGASAFAASLIGSGVQELIFESNSNLTTIGVGAFANRALQAVSIPSNVKTIGAQAFYRCKSLTNVAFERNSELQTIGSQAFAECTKVRNIVIPASVSVISDKAFDQSGLTSIAFESGSALTTIGAQAFKECGFSRVTIPASVTSIGTRAFENSGLTTINYAEDGNLKTIGAYAFEGCNLTEIFIPASVVTLGDGVFRGYGRINAINLADGSQLQTIGAYAFEDCTAITQVTIPSSVTTIGEGAFRNCSGIRTFTFAEGSMLQAIGAYFFEGCNLIAEIVIPASVTSIGEGAFQGLVNLRSVQFEEGSQLESIGYQAFQGCSSLPNITLPDGLVEIRSSVFYGCTALQWVVIPTSIKTIGNMAIERNSATIYYKGNYTQWCKVTMSSGDSNYFQETYRNVYFFDGTQGKPSWRYDQSGNPTPNA